MKKYLLVCLLALTCAVGCKKKETDVLYPEFTLIGNWESVESPLVLTIKNTKNEGDLPRYLEYTDVSRKLQITDATGSKVYEIKFVGKNELFLTDISTKDQISFYRK